MLSCRCSIFICAITNTVITHQLTLIEILFVGESYEINQSLLSHYVNGLKKPREQQLKRIVDGLHKIGSDLQSVMCV